jgi:hypothetical protein
MQVALRTSEEGSQVSENETEPIVTARFEHLETEDGHHVVVGREGKLERCEDEVSVRTAFADEHLTAHARPFPVQPIRTPGAVQGFGVLMVLEEDDDTGDLVVRQVSENSTELLGLSPRYLFRLQCFTHILPRSQDHALRDNIDYLPDPELEGDQTSEEGPQVFLLSGYGEPGSDDSDEVPTERTVNRRREWTCWVAAHRPSQKLWNRMDKHGQPIPPPNLVVLEFELERDIYNPLYPPVNVDIDTSGTTSPLSGSAAAGSDTTASGGRSSSQDSLSTTDSTASDFTMGRKSSIQASEQSNSTLRTIEEHAVAEHRGLMGLEGEEVDLDPADILESTTSHAKPLRALERMRRMTRSAVTHGNNPSAIGPHVGSGAGRGTGRRQSRREGAGAGGVGTMDVFAVLAQINDQLGSAPDIETFLKVVVGVIKDLTQFHRCLVYSFDSQWNGQVVAELVDWSKTHDLYKVGLAWGVLVPYVPAELDRVFALLQGLMVRSNPLTGSESAHALPHSQFPMTDIPPQARELYRISEHAFALLVGLDGPYRRLCCGHRQSPFALRPDPNDGSHGTA